MNHLGKHEQRALIEEGLAGLSAIAFFLADMSGHSGWAIFFGIKLGVDSFCVAKEWWLHAKETKV